MHKLNITPSTAMSIPHHSRSRYKI